MKILTINCGSSSLKYKVFEAPSFRLLSKGLVEKIAEPGSKVADHHQAVVRAFSMIQRDGIDAKTIAAVGHRAVHGGEAFIAPARITKRVIAQIRKNAELAPLHNPANLEGILALKKRLPKVPQVAVFDTAFHQSMPKHAYLYGLTYALYAKQRIRRYGFHGTSHQYVAEEAAKILKKPLSRLKLITAHLGNGCSICAIEKGRCIETSMGFTPLEGLMMGTRCGDIDAAVVFHMAGPLKIPLKKIEDILNKKSGLLGISGVSNDMRLIKKAIKKKNPRARLALEMFIYRIQKYIYTYLGLLGSADAIVFTAGVSEHNPDIVKAISAGCGGSLKRAPRILTIPTDEELMIAKLTYKRLVSRRKR